MRPTLAIALIVLLCSPLSSSPRTTNRLVSLVGRADAEPDGRDGRAPLEVPTSTAAEGEARVDDLAVRVAEKSVLGLLLLGVLWQYRRDFLRKDEKREEQLKDERDRSDRLEEVLGASNAALTNSAVATARQTDATHRLARTVENLERRQAGLPPGSATPHV